MADVQLRDYQGNAITPKGGPSSSVQASDVSLASGTGLNSTNVQAAVKELNDKIAESGGGGGETASYDIAIGKLDESCLINDENASYVGYKTLPGHIAPPDKNTNVVAISFDDGAASDYIGTRKINNKYNFRTTFNLLISPEVPSTMEARKTGYKRMFADGNEIGFHGIMATSFFWRNPLYDVRPDGSATFAPTLAELKTKVNGSRNVFGDVINDNSTFKTVHLDGDSNIANIKLNEATQANWLTAIAYYSVYASPVTRAGIPIGGSSAVRQPNLWWLEHWYNELIDNTLGYSTYEGTITERLAADYEGTYPDATHILSGELDGYGTFTTGLFKGCHTCCNYEVLNRILSAVEAFVQVTYGIKGFTNMAYHGGGTSSYNSLHWTGQDGAAYNNRDCTVIATGHTPLYISTLGRKMSLFDIVLSHGIRMIKRQDPLEGNVVGEIGLIQGQRNIRGSYFNDIIDEYQVNQYLALLGTDIDGDVFDISYEDFIQAMPDDYSQWHKFAYENAGQLIATGLYMTPLYKNAIDVIRRSVGTGKIPVLGFDVNHVQVSMLAGVELLYQYLYKHNIRACSFTEAMNIANEERIVNNAFPNPSFYQSLIDDFGGSSTSEDAYIPDGFSKVGDCDIDVTTSSGNKVLTLSGASIESILSTKVWGLPSGRYKFSATLKGVIKIYKKINSDKDADAPTLLTILSSDNAYTDVQYEFAVPEPHKNVADGTYANTVCDGYEDNFAYIEFDIVVASGATTSIYNPRIDKV